jgi:prophage tail gpP-like protein
MPNADEWCEVRTNYGTFRDWTSVAVRCEVGASPPRHFQLELAEATPAGGPSPTLLDPGGAGRSLLRLKPGDRVDIALAGKLVIEDGYIEDRQSAGDANRHAVQVVGISKDGPIRDVSLDPKDFNGGQFRDYSLEAIANRVLKPYGVKFRLENPPKGANEKFKNVIIHHGETPWELIERLSRQRGCWLWADAGGNIVGGVPQGGGGAVLEEGSNILAIRVHIKALNVGEVVARSQSPGTNDLWGRKAAEISAQATIPGGGKNKSLVVAEHPGTQRDLELRANMEVQAIMAAQLRVVVTHRGWLKPGGNALWELGETVPVKSPTHFPIAGGQLTLKVWAVTYTQDNAGGTITQVELVNEATFSQKYPNLGSGNEFNPAATSAKPESYS